MSTTLREVLGLPVLNRPSDSSSGRNQILRDRFRESLRGANEALAQGTTLGSGSSRSELAQQRERLCGAYQRVLQQGESGSTDNSDKLCRAADMLTERAASVTQNGLVEQQRWQAMEEYYDRAVDRVVELEEASHPKAAVLARLCAAIRDRVNNREYRDATATFQQLKPKLDAIYGEFHQSTAAGTAESNNPSMRPSTNQGGLCVSDAKQRVSRKLADLGQRLSLLSGKLRLAG
jgi:hypothetical protein